MNQLCTKCKRQSSLVHYTLLERSSWALRYLQEFWTPILTDLNLVHYWNFITCLRRSHKKMDSHMNDGFQLTNIFILIIKTSIKLLGFYLFTYFFYDTLIKSFLTTFFFCFCANYCVIVTTNFSRCCGRLRFAAHYFLLWASRRLYCHNNNNRTISNIYNFKLYIELFTK